MSKGVVARIAGSQAQAASRLRHRLVRADGASDGAKRESEVRPIQSVLCCEQDAEHRSCVERMFAVNLL